ncbi:MAG: DUF1365 domain-containing protein [Opitutaceae bacterium]|nr:DUF1365 domain-containing protein [Opitutaceae bacterium]
MRSRIFECRVMHHRFSPRRHRFDYRIFMLALDLDELELLDRRLHLFSANAANLFSLREGDYLPRNERVHNASSAGARELTATALKARVRDLLAAHAIALPEDARVELVTLPRIAGYLFNPVSFFFCRDAAGRPLAAIAEVTNTFREVKAFVLPAASWRAGAFRLCVPKHFYVSPFSDVDVAFDFTLRPPGDRLALAIDDLAGGERTLVTTLTGVARPLTDAGLAVCAMKYPLLTLQVIARIHWHALLLWLKRVPWFAKAARTADQRDLFRPHRSLKPAS